ncbi:MAG TPA: nitroreductase family protein [bacterium]|jgi:nitroreductase
MEVFDAVRTLMAVRSYRKKPVPAESVQRIVEAGRLTGSSMNGQPWHFIVVEDPAVLQELGALARTGPYVAQAALAVVVAVERTKYAISDASRAIQSMMLTAWADGIGSNWVGFLGPAQVKTLLGVPDDLDVLAIVPFGYPAKTIRGRKRRKVRSQVVHRERFGQPFD